MNYLQIWDIPAKDLPKRAEAIWSTPLTIADSEETGEEGLKKITDEQESE